MTTFESRAIKSRFGKDLVVKHKRDDVHLVCSGIDGDGGHLRIFKRADILWALDATANADVKHRADAYEDATRAQDDAREWKARSVAAEADFARVRAELDRTRETYESELAEAERCEREALEKATAIAAERDAWKNRATVAEAAMSAVLAVVDQHPDPCEAPGREYSTCGWKRAFQDVHAIVHPEPAFSLPTEAGARFTAQGKYDAIGQRTEFITFTGGTAPRYIVADKDEDVCYTGAGVMTHYEDHRLLDNNGAGPVTAEDIEGLDSSDVGADQ